MSGVSESYRGKHVRVFRLDRDEVLRRIRSAAAHLLEARPNVVQIWLFGSLARGEAAPGSDADLLIIVRDTASRFLDRSVTLARYFDGVGVGCDLLVYTEAEVSRLVETSFLVKGALEQGVLLAG